MIQNALCDVCTQYFYCLRSDLVVCCLHCMHCCGTAAVRLCAYSAVATVYLDFLPCSCAAALASGRLPGQHQHVYIHVQV